MNITLMRHAQSLLAGRKRGLLAGYDKRREIQRSWNSHLLESHLDNGIVTCGAHMLGIAQQGEIILESEELEDAFYDFLLYEIEDEEGETLIESAWQDHREDDMTNREREVLRAMTESRLVLYTIARPHPRTGLTECRDALADAPLLLMDRTMSLTADAGDVLFSRIITFPEYSMTTGMNMPFPAHELPRLYEIARKIRDKSWEERRKSQEWFKKMFRLYPNHGLPFVYY